jgi:hypothetical protein
VVRELTGKPQPEVAVAGVMTESLNQHYAAISTDIDKKHLCQSRLHLHTSEVPSLSGRFSEPWIACNQLPQDLKISRHGSSDCLGAPVYAKSLFGLFNFSILTCVVPKQWKRAKI